MCVIIHLLPNQTISEEKLYNAACNNWHSWGIISKNSGTGELSVLRKIPDDGVYNDLPEIKKFLEDNIEHERFIHFRYSTRGSTTLDNCHPFEVFNDGHRQVFMMHNGTFNTYGQFNQGKSDTLEVVEKVVVPPLAYLDGDYTEKIFQDFIWKEFWKEKGGGSRVIFISNDLPILKTGQWETYVNDDRDPVFYASNSDYFEKVTRGPVFTKLQEEERRRQQEKEAKEREAKALAQNMNHGGNNNGSTTESGSDKNSRPAVCSYFEGMFQVDPQVLTGLNEIVSHCQNGRSEAGLEDHDINSLHLVTYEEIESMVDSFLIDGKVPEVASFIHYLIQEYHEVYIQKLSSEHKKKSGEKFIATLQNKIQELEGIVVNA